MDGPYDKLPLVNTPSPALVSQHAVRRLPRWALICLCVTYVIFGLVGHNPWKPLDAASFGYMWSLTQGQSSFFNLEIASLAPELDAYLPYWLGFAGIEIFRNMLSADMAARVPFALLTLMSMICTWQAIYYLARNPHAQPVAFAFGGEAKPKDYARSLADAGLLAYVACLGLALPSHELSPLAIQLDSMSIVFVGASMQAFYPSRGLLVWSLGLLMLNLSGAPTLSVVTGLASVLLWIKHPQSGRKDIFLMLLLIVSLIGLSCVMDLWRWRLMPWDELTQSFWEIGELWIWFLWPAWPLALWTLWRWRGHWQQQIWSQHLILPLVLFSICAIASVLTHDPDRTLLLTLPTIAALAAFALPTLERSVSALIDWFTVLFFSGGAVAIWGVWISLETGIPAQPALNVQRLVPGYVHQFQMLGFFIALAATVIWIKLIVWRIGRHPAVIWKSLVLPATGATLCWVLLMTLWLPILDRALSYKPWAAQIAKSIPASSCIYAYGLDRSEIAGLTYHGSFDFRAYKEVENQFACDWLFIRSHDGVALQKVDVQKWTFMERSKRPSDKSEEILIYKHQVKSADE